VTDPYDSKMVGLKYPKLQADVVTISHQHEDHNFLDQVKDYKRVVSGPGEYEISGISIIGVTTYHDDKKGQLRGKNTVYVIEMDDVRIAHMGDLGHKLGDKALALMGSVDVLMVPVGGEYTINDAVAAEVVRSIEPTVTIPMHYQQSGLNPEVFKKLDKVDKFLSEVGLSVEKTNKLSFNKSDIGEDQRVIVLEKK
jgi:L-ascorbate metabolism protein UlaG (beta-lactamase superfamily)